MKVRIHTGLSLALLLITLWLMCPSCGPSHGDHIVDQVLK